ncbi:unnamed protein product [marine sediment metagenome]|uniref:Rubrerythrin diiron-binding domain-containing protein n=1 Tax=marine sediment metagenome TaxID=412755 RepID=X0U8K7_9ZZZZ
MADIFSGSEIVKIGIEIEKNGKDFYTKAAEKSESDKAKGLFNYLAAEEEKHITAFEKILDTLDQERPAESFPGEYVSYMKDLAGKYVFTRKDRGVKIAEGCKDDKEVIERSIGFENDSIVFYLGMRKAVPVAEHRVIDELIDQEKTHLKKLSELRSNL